MNFESHTKMVKHFTLTERFPVSNMSRNLEICLFMCKDGGETLKKNQ